MKNASNSGALSRIRKYFPNVRTVKDAVESLPVSVTKGDVATSKRRKHSECAMAVACKRSEHADGMIVATAIAYVIKNTTATRFLVPHSVAREIISFDRGAGFEPGEYKLVAPPKSQRLENIGGGHGPHRKRGTGKKPLIHRTTDVRAILGSDNVR